MKIFLATDHAGFYLKEKVKFWLGKWGYDYEDLGAFEYIEQDDYPKFIRPAALKVSEDSENNRAIVFGGSGQGEAMVANRLPKVRAVVYCANNLDIIKLSREHNDANVLSIGARFVSEEEAKEAIKLWLETPFSGEERHKRRIEKIDK
jgi:ribose 5-phosphate isomerase B